MEVIKVLMHDPVCSQYPLISMTDALTRLVNAKQTDYIKRFKQLRDVAVSHMGTEMLHKFCEFQVEFKDLETDPGKKNYKDKVFEAWMAYLLIRGSDQSKYGLLTKNFISQYSLGNDQYPRT
ncbi:hypothetical protein, partial [Acidithiobacillus sp.]|uniref:hypothetical protein n=1 Tax=Acidithiobacillus sp. TaxID=1872118 RepID=UPI003CFFF1B9